jgi:hypothetical protein
MCIPHQPSDKHLALFSHLVALFDQPLAFPGQPSNLFFVTVARFEASPNFIIDRAIAAFRVTFELAKNVVSQAKFHLSE